MLEVSLPCHHEYQLVLFTVIDGVLIANGPTRLNKGRNAGLVSQLHTITEGKEGITGHYRAL
jgi:hypothetical protein